MAEAKKKDAQTKEMLEMFQKQTLASKKIPCPKWTKDEPFKSFSSRLQHWDKHYQSKGKYLELLESLQETGRTTEKARIELDVLNKQVNPDDDDIISKILERLGSIFGRAKMDEIIIEHFDLFHEIKFEPGEDLEKFLLRFEMSVAS